MIRLLDIIISFIGLILFFPLFILISCVVALDKGSPFLIQKRVGFNLKNFNLIKFRTMKIGTKFSATHLINSSNITFFGSFLRKFKLDELPQLLNVLIGHMSLVGPRPCLPNQKRLIMHRKKRGVYKVMPGITGLAQISGIDMSTPIFLAKTDSRMIKKMSLYYYFYYIFKTFNLVIKK